MTRAPAPCQCGEWSGEQCAGTAPAGNRVRVEFMPDEHRSSHDAAGNCGSYPDNGSQRVWVSPECAALMIQFDGEWCEIVKRDQTHEVES